MSAAAVTILIADDDEGDRRQMRRAIQQSGLACALTEAETVEQAVAACEQCEFDCAILDYQLPGQDGLAGISELRQRYAHMPIVMSTGRGDEWVAADAMKRGASDYIPKSGVNAISIRRVIDRAVEKAALQRKVTQQREELENFARVLAHDLRAPGAAIQTCAMRIADRLASGRPDKALEYAQWAIQTSERMNALIETLHRYTAADAKVAFETVEMNQAKDAALDNLRDLLQEAGAQVTADPLPAVRGNEPLLIQLLQNLIANAVKYCDRAVAAIHLAAQCGAENRWTISVTDNGIGIPQGQLKRVFEPFVRLAGAGDRRGSGLGLATCKRIVERHGGTIWCQSKLGEGTTFFFTLAAAQIEAGEEEPAERAAGAS